jgi:uncharacterized membrane protein YqgA involved in biofilm formation
MRALTQGGGVVIIAAGSLELVLLDVDDVDVQQLLPRLLAR